jgi:tetratricopeptide (TPR) repeat protein
VAAIGRAPERAALTGQLARITRTGRVGVVSVLGAQGMGKTRLVEAFRADVRGDKSAFVAAARCSSAETLPLRVIDSLLDDLISEASYDARVPIERCYPRHGAELCATFPCAAVLFGRPDPTPTGDTSPSPTEQGRTSVPTRALGLRALADLLARVSEHVPLVLIVDDLQNSDDDGLDALLRLILDIAECRVLVVLAGSTAARDRIHGLLEAGRKYLGSGAVTQIELGPMSGEELAAIAWEELWSWRGPPEVVDSLCEKSFGNPGTCVWYARALRSSGTEPLPAGEDMDRLVFRRAWDVLPPAAKDVLAYVSIAEQALPRSVLVQLLPGGAEEADAAVRDLEHHAFLRRHRYEGTEDLRLWHHHIAGHVLGMFSAEALQVKHLRLAQVLARAGEASAGRAAHHFREHGSTALALDHLGVAIAVARREHAHRRACELLELAIGLATGRGVDPTDRPVAEGERRRRFEIALADCLGAAGRLRESAELSARLCRDADVDPDDRARLRLSAIGHYGALADAGKVRALVAEELGGDADPSAAIFRVVGLRLRITARPPWAQKSWGPPPEGWARHLEVLWTAGSRLIHIDPIYAAYLISKHLILSFQSGCMPHQARALAFEAVMSTSQGEKRLDRASTLIAEAERMANQCDDDRVRAFVHQGAGFMWGNVGRYREAIAEGRRCIDAFERSPDTHDYELSHARVELGWRLTQVGSHREILASVPALIRRAVESEDPVLASAFFVQAANAYLAADRPDEAAQHLAEAERWCPETFEAGRLGVFLARLACLQYTGQIDAALSAVMDGRAAVEGLRILKLPAVKTAYAYRVGTVLCWSLAQGGPSRSRRFLAALRKALRKEPSDVAKALCRLLDAGACTLEGKLERARGLLREAIDRFGTLGWENISALASTRYRELQGSPADPQALELLEQLGVVDPSRWAKTIMPPIG